MIYRKEKETKVIVYFGEELPENIVINISIPQKEADDNEIEKRVLNMIEQISLLDGSCMGEYIVQIDGELHYVHLVKDRCDIVELAHVQLNNK